MTRILAFLLALASAAGAANKTCPSGTLGATDTVTARAATALVFQGVQSTGSPVVAIEICCVGACDASGSWAPITGGSMALSAGTPTLAVAVANPTCMYRATATGGVAAVGFSCAGP